MPGREYRELAEQARQSIRSPEQQAAYIVRQAVAEQSASKPAVAEAAR